MATKTGSALGDIAWELYCEPLEEFTQTRNARAKELKDAGDRRLAGHVCILEKPSVAAWLLNQMVRQRADEVDQVLELGAQLRAAQEDPAADELRRGIATETALLLRDAAFGRFDVHRLYATCHPETPPRCGC